MCAFTWKKASAPSSTTTGMAATRARYEQVSDRGVVLGPGADGTGPILCRGALAGEGRGRRAARRSGRRAQRAGGTGCRRGARGRSRRSGSTDQPAPQPAGSAARSGASAEAFSSGWREAAVAREAAAADLPRDDHLVGARRGDGAGRSRLSPSFTALQGTCTATGPGTRVRASRASTKRWMNSTGSRTESRPSVALRIRYTQGLVSKTMGQRAALARLEERRLELAALPVRLRRPALRLERACPQQSPSMPVREDDVEPGLVEQRRHRPVHRRAPSPSPRAGPIARAMQLGKYTDPLRAAPRGACRAARRRRRAASPRSRAAARRRSPRAGRGPRPPMGRRPEHRVRRVGGPQRRRAPPSRPPRSAPRRTPPSPASLSVPLRAQPLGVRAGVDADRARGGAQPVRRAGLLAQVLVVRLEPREPRRGPRR